MPLTPENMESRLHHFSHTIYRDIARMDETQLERYIRDVFSGKRDLSFLPENFWDYHFDMNKHGDTTDGRDKPSPAAFFAGMHDSLGHVATKGFKIGHDGDDDPDFEYRVRFRKILKKLLEEAWKFQGKPTWEQKRLAAFAVEAFGEMRSIDTFFAINRSSGKGRGTPSVDYPQRLLDDLGDLAEDRIIMQGHAEALIRDERYGDLKLRYDGPVYLRD